MDAKDLIQQTLDYWRYKLDHNLCTMEEIDSIARMMENNLRITGTVEDFAKFCGKPEQAVRNVISRKVLDKPRRRVYYNFFPFLKNIPDKWLNKK